MGDGPEYAISWLYGHKVVALPEYFVRDPRKIPGEIAYGLRYAGIRPMTDPSLPSNVIECRDCDGTPISRLTWD